MSRKRLQIISDKCLYKFFNKRGIKVAVRTRSGGNKKRYYTTAEKKSFAKGCRIGARNANKAKHKRTFKSTSKKRYRSAY